MREAVQFRLCILACLLNAGSRCRYLGNVRAVRPCFPFFVCACARVGLPLRVRVRSLSVSRLCALCSFVRAGVCCVRAFGVLWVLGLLCLSSVCSPSARCARVSFVFVRTVVAHICFFRRACLAQVQTGGSSSCASQPVSCSVQTKSVQFRDRGTLPLLHR